MKLADPRTTWLYFEPASGQLFLKSDKGTRARRWLYNGLHSLDFRVLLEREYLWLIVIWLLSLCGLALSITSAVISWKWLRRQQDAASGGASGEEARARESSPDGAATAAGA